MAVTYLSSRKPIMQKHLPSYVAELIGTFALCFIGGGVICTDYVTKAVSLPGIAMAHGIILAVAVTATMSISGGQLNPAITICLWVFRKIDTDKAIGYVISQLLGGAVAG